MFGGQDDNTAAPLTGGGGGAPQDDTLKGVAELVGGTAPSPSIPSPAPASQDNGQSGTFFPKPSDDAQQPGAPAPAAEPEAEAPAPASSASTNDAADADSDDLLDIKQKALQQLTPLVDQLEQNPVEKFRTTMMLIQASDNRDLLKEAYEAAQAIEDEKARAQALLDVVNEINYFTQPKEQ